MRREGIVFILKALCVFILMMSGALSNAEELVVRHIKTSAVENHRASYFISLLSLALSKSSAADTSVRLEPTDKVMKISRAMDYLVNDSLDVVWSMTSPEREEQALPVRVPLLKGLLGHRIFIIRQGDQEKFSKIQHMHELKGLNAGQGVDWADTKILRYNNIPVITGSNYLGLFSILQRKRFDYFPRGVHEPWQELVVHHDKNLMVEQSLLVRYKSPIFFFVSKSNEKLRKLLEEGLRIAIKDGSFNALLYNHKITKQIFDLAGINQRRTFDIENPLLTDETRLILNDSSLWYQSEDEKATSLSD